MQRGRLRPPVRDGDHHAQIGDVGLRVVHRDRPVAVLGEHAGVDQLVFRILSAARGIAVHQLPVGVGGLRIVIAPAHRRVGRRRVLVPVIFLDVLAVVAGVTGQAEHPLLENGVLAVPQRERETERLLLVTDAGHPVLIPAEHAGPGMIMRKVRPGIAVLAVVFANRAPGPLGQIGSPRPPGSDVRVGLGEAGVLGGGGLLAHGLHHE
jgi:hypothetical protein